MMYGVPPPVGLGPCFSAFILGLRRALGFPVDRERAPIPLMDVVVRGLGRRMGRFLALLARFYAGTLPVPRARRAVASKSALTELAPRKRAPVAVPRYDGWLVDLVGWQAAAYTGYLEILVADPEMTEFLAAAPQAGRLLRPLWRMLNRQPLPEALRASPRSPASSAPTTADAGPDEGGPSPHALPASRDLCRERVRADTARSGLLKPA